MTSEAVPAATLILVREQAGQAPELLMAERAATMAFAAGALVFPGGRVDRGDTELASPSFPEDGSARVAAVREMLEECGVAVAIRPRPDTATCRSLQQALADGADFGSLLAEFGLSLDPDALTPVARWIPPAEVPRRFDTRFFLANANNTDVQPHVDDRECVSARCISASDALAEMREQKSRVIYPTRKMLERLAQFDSYAAMVADARSHEVVPITARTEQRQGVAVVVIPEGLGFPTTVDPLSEISRG